MPRLLLGITGTIGAGKNTVADYLIKRHGFAYRFGSDLLAEELARRGLPATRDNFRALANEFRKNGINLLMADPVFQAIANAENKAVVGFFRTPGEIDNLKAAFPHAHIIAVDAPVAFRYKRIAKRADERDNVSFEQFVAQEEREMHSDNPYEQNMAACLKKADYTIRNESTQQALEEQIEALLEALTPRS